MDAAKTFQLEERRYVYSTPKTYLELLKLYNLLLRKKRKITDEAIVRLANGLQKLKETADAVEQIEADLRVALEEAEKKKITSEGIAETVSKEKAIVEVETSAAEEEAAKTKIIQDEVSAKAKATSDDLARAEPAVEEAMAALNSLNKKDLSDCKGMGVPPGGVCEVFAATMVLLARIHPGIEVIKSSGKVKQEKGENGPNIPWPTIKKQMLSDVGLYLQMLLEFKDKADAGEVPAVNWKEVRPYLEYEFFNYETIMTKNSAAAGVVSWVNNIVIYYDIVTTVEPKRKALAEATTQLNAANEKLAIVTTKVAELQAKLSKLVAEFDAANKEKQDALDTVERGHKKLDLAQRLTTALASENKRWGENVIVLREDKDLLDGDTLLAAAFISYIGPFTKDFRDRLVGDVWVPFLRTAAGGESIPMSEGIQPVNVLCDSANVASWNSQGLPADPVSTENGAILCNSSRWPLMIDPQLQGIEWVRNKEGGAERNLTILRLGQDRMIEKMGVAVEAGHSVLIENMGEKVDAVLNPIIQRAKIKKGKRFFVKIGETEMEFHPSFALFLHTKLSNPHYAPEIQAETTLINFMVTLSGLEDQLLALVVRKERLDLALKNEALINEQNENKIRMKDLEDGILSKLAAAEGDITEDVELIEGLEDSKRISNEITKKVEIATATQEAIKITSEKYREVAGRSSLLFFLMSDLNKIHTYYIYSLASFTKVFYFGIDKVTEKPEGKSDEIEEGEKVEGEKAEGEKAEGGEDAETEKKEEKEEGGDADKTDGGDEEEGDEGVEEGKPAVVELTDAELEARREVLIESISITVFNYIRRGLFDRDKLTVSTMLLLKILFKDGRLEKEDMDNLVSPKLSLDPGNMGPVDQWLPGLLWPKAKGLESMKIFNGLGDSMQADDDWQKWFDHPTAETAKLPGEFKDLEPIHRLILLRALRPDRVPKALAAYTSSQLGPEYVTQPSFDMNATFIETSADTPIFFVLFPGVDPTPTVEAHGKKLGFTIDNGKFVNISMGQGQEKPAENTMEALGSKGGWVMLQNCHLMSSWVPQLERKFEIVAATAHEDFRLYLSAEPPPLPSWKNMPESLMQSCIKVANEAPSDIQSNLRRAMDNFSQDTIEACTKPDAFKACLFSLCWFHSLLLGRTKFGQQGWSRAYPFNTGDLTICADVLCSYLDNNPETPYQDLRYLFGEIMYGGHITDFWDRRTCNTYLAVHITPALFDGHDFGLKSGPELVFKSPDAKAFDYQKYCDYIENDIPEEKPMLFGLHSNAEIGNLTKTAENVFFTVMSLSGGGDGAGSGGGVRAVMEDLTARLPENFEMVGIEEKAGPLKEGPTGPYVIVAVQESERMNVLLTEIRRSLIELDKGLKGQLNMSETMDDLVKALVIDQVPGRDPFSKASWEKIAWPSSKSLIPWFGDMLLRTKQLVDWTEELVRPMSLWLPGVFNPTAFLTAVMQVTARESQMPLDQMTTSTFITTMLDPAEATTHPKDGGFVHGIFLEGARWPTGEDQNVGEPVDMDGTEVAGVITDSRLKELLAPMPVIYIKAVTVQKEWEASAVGYLRHDDNVYDCPTYITTFRGPTFVTTATLTIKDPAWKWVLAGVALVFQTDD
jgi:dynein heavy chain